MNMKRNRMMESGNSAPIDLATVSSTFFNAVQARASLNTRNRRPARRTVMKPPPACALGALTSVMISSKSEVATMKLSNWLKLSLK